MRALILAAAAGATVAAVALGGCATVSDAVSDVTGTETGDRCAWYETRLPIWREVVTLAVPGSLEADLYAANILVGEAYLANHCAAVLGDGATE